MEAPLRLWQPAAFYEAASKENLLAGAVFGMLLVMIVYNLFVYLSTRDANYIYYISFVASYLMFWATLKPAILLPSPMAEMMSAGMT